MRLLHTETDAPFVVCAAVAFAGSHGFHDNSPSNFLSLSRLSWSQICHPNFQSDSVVKEQSLAIVLRIEY